MTGDEVACSLGERLVVLDEGTDTKCVETGPGAEACHEENALQSAAEGRIQHGEDGLVEEILAPFEMDIIDVFEVGTVENLVDGLVSGLERVEMDADDEDEVGEAEKRIRQESRGELELFAFCMLQSVGPKLVAIDGEGGGQSPSTICITNEGHDNLFVLHPDDHALAIAEGEEKHEGVKDDALNGRGEGDEVGTKPHGFEDKSNIGDGEFDLLVIRFGGKMHDFGALVVDPLANLGDWSCIQRTWRKKGVCLQDTSAQHDKKSNKSG